jgi:hypothetical protein
LPLAPPAAKTAAPVKIIVQMVFMVCHLKVPLQPRFPIERSVYVKVTRRQAAHSKRSVADGCHSCARPSGRRKLRK